MCWPKISYGPVSVVKASHLMSICKSKHILDVFSAKSLISAGILQELLATAASRYESIG